MTSRWIERVRSVKLNDGLYLPHKDIEKIGILTRQRIAYSVTKGAR